MVAPPAKFRNLSGVTWTQPLTPLLKWRILRRFETRVWWPGHEVAVPVRHNDGRALAEDGTHLTWIGHATFAVRLGGRLVLTDPIWGDCVDLRRLRPPGVALRHLPPVDVVTVTHNHYDHCHLPTLRWLAKRFDPHFVVPRRVGRILRGVDIHRVTELDWWEHVDVGGLRVTLVPAQHWSARGPFDTNRTLWGGFVYAAPDGVAYHAGDTAYAPDVFDAIARRFVIDWAMLPIGAYDPEWFLRTQHMGPEDAARAFERLRARHFVAMHHGTFRLTDEPLDEPLRRCRADMAARGWTDRLIALEIGETKSLR